MTKTKINHFIFFLIILTSRIKIKLTLTLILSNLIGNFRIPSISRDLCGPRPPRIRPVKRVDKPDIIHNVLKSALYHSVLQ